MNSVADLRRDYTRYGLTESTLDQDPVEQFRIWFDQAVAANLLEPNAMTVATADSKGNPSARILLLKGFDESGFSFYTNYLSDKGKILGENPKAALVFFWGELERQVRVSGEVVKTSREESEAYFHSRPRNSQIGAHVSQQGQVIADRREIEARQVELEKEFEGKEVPLPDYWGGYRLVPSSVEFWQGRPSRLHDRIRYSRQQDGRWKIERLCP
jgi:pyridoxamine 5'-phosphate oxidase